MISITIISVFLKILHRLCRFILIPLFRHTFHFSHFWMSHFIPDRIKIYSIVTSNVIPDQNLFNRRAVKNLLLENFSTWSMSVFLATACLANIIGKALYKGSNHWHENAGSFFLKRRNVISSYRFFQPHWSALLL